MAAVIEKRPPAVNAVLGDGEEEVLRVEVLVNHVQPALLMCEALALTTLHEARILEHGHVCQYMVYFLYAAKNTYRVLALVAPDLDKGIVAFFNMNSEKVLGWKVFPALQASVGVKVVVVGFVLGVGGENHGFFVRR